MQIRFDDERVLVTGAAQGNGRALALGFAQAGADVILVDIHADNLRLACDEVLATGRRAWPHVVDITDRVACRDVALRVQQEAGPIRHLINNAGVDGHASVGDPEGDAVWDAVMAVNIGGLYNITSAFVAQVVETKGTILNVGSTRSFVGQARMTAYASSKAAIHNFTQSLALELAPRGVRVNMLAPGLIETGLTAGLFADADRLENFLKRICMGRAGSPQELVGPALLACSRHASYMTGSTIRVDGGWLAI